MKKICLLSSLLFLLQTPVAPAAPLLRMQFAADTDGAAPATTSAVAGGTSAKPTALLNASGTSILIRTSPIDAGTFQMFEPGKVVEMNSSGTASAPAIRFDGAAGDAANTGKVRVDLDVMIDSGTTWSGTVPAVVVRTGTLYATLKDLSDAPVCTASISLSTGEVNLVSSGTDGSSPTPVLLGVAPLGDHVHLQVLLDYTSGTATLTGDNLLYTPDPVAYTRTVSGSFASSRSFGRLDLSVSGGTGKVELDNLCINAIPDLPAKLVTDGTFNVSGTDSDETILRNALTALVGSGTIKPAIGKLTLELNKTYLISHPIPLAKGHDFFIEGNGATIKMADDTPLVTQDPDGKNKVNYWMLGFSGCENFTVQNLTVDANRDHRGEPISLNFEISSTTAPVTDTHSISVANSRLFRFVNTKAINAVADGFYISAGSTTGDPETYPRNGLLLNCESRASYRQGLSIINGNHIAVVSGTFSQTRGRSPASGIDIEANKSGTDPSKNYVPSHVGILIRDVDFQQNDGCGVEVAQGGGPRNVTIEGCSFIGTGSNAQLGTGIVLGSSYSLVQNNFFEDFSTSVTDGGTDGIIYMKSLTPDGWYILDGNNKINYNWLAHISHRAAAINIASGPNIGNEVRHNVMTDINGIITVRSATANTTVTDTGTSAAPVGYWALDSSSGTTILDGSGNGLNGAAYNSPIWVSGTYGNALSFNGTNQYGQLPASSTLNVTSHFTLAAWFYANPFSTTASHIVLGKNGDFRLGYSGGTNFGFYSPLTGWVYATALKGMWHHAAVTFDGNRVRLYLDGDQVKNNEVKPGNLTATSQAFIGSITGTTYPFHGLIDDVRMYNVVLSRAEIHDVMSFSATP